MLFFREFFLWKRTSKFISLNIIFTMLCICLITIVISTQTIRRYVASAHKIAVSLIKISPPPVPTLLSLDTTTSSSLTLALPTAFLTVTPSGSSASGNVPVSPTVVQSKGTASPPTTTPTPTTALFTIPPQGVYEGCHIYDQSCR